MINIIFAKPKKGKTLYLVCRANDYAFDFDLINCMNSEISKLKSSGFNNLDNISNNVVASNFDMTFKKFRYLDRKPRRINPYRLGYANKFVKTHFSRPYEVYFIDEAQKYFNSRMALYYPDWQSRFYEQHEHFHLNFFLSTQRPMLIDANIRDLSYFIEIIDFKRVFNRLGNFLKIEIVTRRIENSALFEKYIASGNRDKSCYEEIIETFYVDPFNLYDCRSCKPKFFDGHLEENFDFNISDSIEETFDAYVKYLEKYDDELPKNFYVKRSKK